MSETTVGGFVGYRNMIIELLEAGEPFEQVEQAINGIAQLTEDQRAALWLVAFSKRDRAPHQTPDLLAIN